MMASAQKLKLATLPSQNTALHKHAAKLNFARQLPGVSHCPPMPQMILDLTLWPNGRSSSGEGRPGAGQATFKSIIRTDPADMPSVDAKPEYHTVIATVARIPDSNLWYTACPENNRKVCYSLAF